MRGRSQQPSATGSPPRLLVVSLVTSLLRCARLCRCCSCCCIDRVVKYVSKDRDGILELDGEVEHRFQSPGDGGNNMPHFVKEFFHPSHKVCSRLYHPFHGAQHFMSGLPHSCFRVLQEFTKPFHEASGGVLLVRFMGAREVGFDFSVVFFDVRFGLLVQRLDGCVNVADRVQNVLDSHADRAGC